VAPGEAMVTAVVRSRARKSQAEGEDPQLFDEARVVTTQDGAPTSIYGGDGSTMSLFEAGLVNPEVRKEVERALRRGRAEKKKRRKAVNKKID
jgi:hypothetical protein